MAGISIHAPREGGDSDNISADASLYISIHAPREGGDPTIAGYYNYTLDISIHAPREGGDVPDVLRDVGVVEFQSTPPARGATTNALGSW